MDTKSLIITTAINFIVTGLLVFRIQKYFEGRWAPIIAESVLKKQNFINSKKETYSQAIDIITRFFATTDWKINGKSIMPQNRNIGGTPPTELEMNACMIKLYFYSPNDSIPKSFKKILLPLKPNENLIAEVSKLFNAIAMDIGNDAANIKTEEFEFIVTPSKDSIK